MNEGVNVHAYDALRRTGIPFRMYSCLAPNVPKISSEKYLTDDE